MITIVDYGMGNIGSIANMIAKVGGRAKKSSDPHALRDAEKLILPGVGHFDRGMENLARLKLTPVLTELVLTRRVPVLGICLGMQLMCTASEEGQTPGLGWINADVRKFDATRHPGMKVPHMGWNVATPSKASALFDASATEPQRFYFVHSYYVACDEPSHVLAVAHYEEEFCAAFARDNVYGVQFHPEKSHVFGMDLFRRFVEL
jgi:glutamine amidotransferase